MNKKDLRILLFGAAGQVGHECNRLFRQAGYTVVDITRKEIDFKCVENVDDIVHALSDCEQPSIVVNAMAYTAVDKAESEPDEANKINHLSVGYLAQYCVRYNIPLVHISTDYVFDGNASTPYIETSKVSPLGVYGNTKWLGEQAVSSNLPQHIILRTSWVFGGHGNNFVKTILRLAAERETLTIVADQYGCPTYAGDIAKAILCVIERYTSDLPMEWGVYHCVGEGGVSWCEFSQVIVDEACHRGLLTRPPTIIPITTAEYPTPAARPAYSVLDTGKLHSSFDHRMPSWKKGLSDFFDSIPTSSSESS